MRHVLRALPRDCETLTGIGLMAVAVGVAVHAYGIVAINLLGVWD